MNLPQWLDNLIFEELGGIYSPSYSDMTNIHDDKERILNYLGTYFPRSYAEAYNIFTSYFQKYKQEWENRESISVFDFGCGTGGEIIGLLIVLNETFPNLKKVKVVALDGNQHALRLFEKIMTYTEPLLKYELCIKSSPIHIEDFYDLETLGAVFRDKFDIVMTFKAVCEFVTEQEFEHRNPYQHLLSFFLDKTLEEDGIVVLEDITTFNKKAESWIPVMMDKGINHCPCSIIHRNDGYNKQIEVKHSHKNLDVSKVAWRIIIKQ